MLGAFLPYVFIASLALNKKKDNVFMWFVIKVILSAVMISSVSWLAGKKIGLAGFLTALPLTSILALAFSQVEYQDAKQSVHYAKSIFVAVPLSLSFFIPFLFAEKWSLGFWGSYLMGLVLLGASYFIHTKIIS